MNPPTKDKEVKSEDNPYYKCLFCHKYVDPAVGHIAASNGTCHWHCHPELKHVFKGGLRAKRKESQNKNKIFYATS